SYGDWSSDVCSSDLDQRALVVRVAGDVAVAVVDLDEPAETGALTGPGDHARGDRDHLVADGAGEIDALVERLATIEGVGTLAEEIGRASCREMEARQ